MLDLMNKLGSPQELEAAIAYYCNKTGATRSDVIRDVELLQQDIKEGCFPSSSSLSPYEIIDEYSRWHYKTYEDYLVAHPNELEKYIANYYGLVMNEL